RPVTDFAAQRTRDEVRRFAIKCLEAGAPWVAIAAGAPDPVVVLGRAKTLSPDLKALVPELLERTGGKGGGSPDLVQASAADAPRAEAAWRWAVEHIPGRLYRRFVVSLRFAVGFVRAFTPGREGRPVLAGRAADFGAGLA